jgi:asparagine synthase (glutamine-hydrolysing)
VSAIVGLYKFDGKPTCRSEVEQMLDRLAHRGTDRAGVWSEGFIALGHRLLWTTPESLHEKQPLLNQSGDVVITADARIDNREELMTTLDLNGNRSSSITDSQLILAAYEKWGERSAEKLIGDFAFVIWDAKKQVLVCARDPLGVKPFYYHQSDRMFAFASEIKALITMPDVPTRMNELRIAYHLEPNFLSQDKEITFYQDIFRLPPANSMIVSAKGARRHCYWSLEPQRELHLRSDDQYSEAFREIFIEAVRCRVRSPFPVGSTLSGGLDSSSIACTARHVLAGHGNGGLHTFSAIFPELPERELRQIDERPFVDAVVSQGNDLSPHYIRADRLGPLDEVERVLWHEDEAVFAPNLYMHWGLYKEGQRQGVRVFLDGIDGDTTVSHGLEYLAELIRLGRWISMVKEATALSRKSNRAFPPWKVIWQYGLHPLVPQKCRRIWSQLRGRSQLTEFLNPVINPGFAKRVGLAERAQALLDPLSVPGRNARAEHSQGLNSGLLPYVLELADKAASAFSLDPRYPFCDRRLVEFCLAVPADQKLHRGWTRVIMRRAMANILPEEVRWRIGKANLSPNFQLRLLNGHRELLEKIILKDPGLIEKYVDVPALQDLYSRYVSQQTAKDALVVYGVAMLALWLSQFGVCSIDSKPWLQPVAYPDHLM